MESQDLNRLITKYWEGECTMEEEALLLAEGNKGNIPKELSDYLIYIQGQKEICINDPEFDRQLLDRIDNQKPSMIDTSLMIGWKIAAGILLFIVIGWGLIWQNKEGASKQISAQEYANEEAQIAYAEVKKALLLLSNNLNEGIEHSMVIGEFHKVKEELKANDNTEQTNEDN